MIGSTYEWELIKPLFISEIFRSGAPEHANALSISRLIGIAFDRDQPIITKVFDQAHMTFASSRAHDKNQSRL